MFAVGCGKQIKFCDFITELEREVGYDKSTTKPKRRRTARKNQQADAAQPLKIKDEIKRDKELHKYISTYENDFLHQELKKDFDKVLDNRPVRQAQL